MLDIGLQFDGLSAFLINTSHSNDKNGIILLPVNSAPYNKVVIWLHGVGDDGAGWVHLMPSLSLENTKFILPNAPIRPIFVYGGTQMAAWSDIRGKDTDSVEDRVGMEESAKYIQKLIQAEVASGISPDRIAVGGFSQGGALALHVCLRSHFSLAGCIALSTWLPLRDDYPAALSPATSKTLKILQVHGCADETVSLAFGKHSHEILKSLMQDPEPKFMEIQGMKHCQHPHALAAIRFFINEELGFHFMI